MFDLRRYLVITILLGCFAGYLQQAEASDWEGVPPEAKKTASEECDVVTIPDHWLTSQNSPRTTNFAGGEFYVVSYKDRSETLERWIPVFARIQSDGDEGEGEWSVPHSPIEDPDRLAALVAIELNANSDVGLHLMVNSDPEWQEKAEVWDEVANEVFSPGRANVATGLFSVGDFFLSMAFASALGDIVGPVQSASQAVQALQAVGKGLKFTSAGVDLIESVSDVPGSDDRSLAPALHALAEIDEDLYNEFKEREHLSRQINDFATAAGEGLDRASAVVAFAQLGIEAHDAVDAIRNDEHIPSLRVALSLLGNDNLDEREQALIQEMGVALGKHAYQIAGDVALSSFESIASSEVKRLVSRDISSTEEGFSDMVLTANVYAMALQRYAEVLAESRQKLLDPSGFNSDADYNNALAQYQYRVYKYFELHYTMARVLREYSELINTGVVGSLSVPSSAIETFASHERELEKLYRDVAEELRAQSEVMDILASKYPDFAGDCSGAFADSDDSDRSDTSADQPTREPADLFQSMHGVWKPRGSNLVYEDAYIEIDNNYISFYGAYAEGWGDDGYVCEQADISNIRFDNIDNTIRMEIYGMGIYGEETYLYLSSDRNTLLAWDSANSDFMKRYTPDRLLSYLNEVQRQLEGDGLDPVYALKNPDKFDVEKQDEFDSYGFSSSGDIESWKRSDLPSWAHRECS